MVNRIILLSILAIGSLMGQGQNTIYQTLFTNNVTKPKVVNISPPSSIGQGGHQVMVIFTSKPSYTCSAPNPTMKLEGSYDNSSWVPFGSGPINGVAGQIRYIQAQGLYPYTRFTLFDFDNVNCYASAYYSGSTLQSPITTLTANGTSNLVTPITGCDLYAYKFAAPGNNFVAAISTSLTFKLCYLGLASAGTSTAAVVLGQSSDGITCTSSPGYTITPTYALTASTNIITGTGLGIIGKADAPQYAAVCLLTTGSNVTAVIGYAVN